MEKKQSKLNNLTSNEQYNLIKKFSRGARLYAATLPAGNSYEEDENEGSKENKNSNTHKI